MSGNLATQKVEGIYNTIFRGCLGLNTELHKMVPLAKQMHLLSSNAVSSAARAGSEGDAFRVLTQDIQLLGNDVAECIDDSQRAVGTISMLASELVRLFSHYVVFADLLFRLQQSESNQSCSFIAHGQQSIVNDICKTTKQLAKSLSLLTTVLEPINLLVKKGEYLAVFSSVEAANTGQHGERFEAVSAMLRTLVDQLAEHSARQSSLLRDLSDAMEKLNHHGKRLYAC